ncbi:MAG: CRISPR-associated protein Cas4 [Thermoprotei archaeon]
MIDTKPYPGLQPVLVKQYVYCPVIPWIIAKYGVCEPPTDSMVLGLEEKTTSGEGQVRIRTRRGATRIDEIVEYNGSQAIIEHKKYRSRSIHRYLVQAMTEYLIARDAIEDIEYIVLDNGGDKRVFRIEEDLIEETEKIIEKYMKTINSDKPPQPVRNPAKCKWCWYSRFCPYT